jgi:ligand-binding SRPBCC domain-containing protein
MPLTRIILETTIQAPRERCFDLSRSIDLHIASTAATREVAVKGRTGGLIEQDESVTWRARHFFRQRELTSRITEMKRPYYFTDVMVDGPFESMVHVHTFTQDAGFTRMQDEFLYALPWGWFGKLVDFLFLRRYMLKLLKTRNAYIQQAAESAGWRRYVF